MMKEKESKLKLFIYITSFIVTLIYIIYRIFFTIPSDSVITIVIAILVLILEIFDAFFYGVYVFNILIYKKDSPKVPDMRGKKFPGVDVFIATYNEEVELLRGTIEACKKMRYPTKDKVHIYLCDDGHREEMKKLAQELDIHYIDRENHKDAKAGNYNNALKHTHSPYIATFDADMRPEVDFLEKTIPFFMEDSNLGFVQLPQCFREPDLFQAKFKIFKSVPFEQYYFYHKIQMAKNKTNSVVYCGTNTVLSRKALVEAGGYATKTITEDIATGMIIESLGYHAIALDLDLVYGVSVKNTDSLLKQRSRWCRGCIQAFKHYIIPNKKLKIRQRLDYISAIYYWSYGIRTIFYLLVPLLFSIFDKRIIQGQVYLFLILFFIQFILKRFVVDYAENHRISSTWNRIYETILSPVIAYESIKELIGLGNLKFEVTSKETSKKKKVSFRVVALYVTHLVLFILTVTGLIFSFYKSLLLGFKDYLMPLFWLSTNLIYLGIALIFDCSIYQEEDNCRDNNREKYSIKSIFQVFYRYFRYEFKWKEILVLITCIFLLFGFIGTDFSNVYRINHNMVFYNQKLHIRNGVLVNQRDEVVHLRGVSSHNLYWFGEHYNYNNLKVLKDTWGVNVFRVAFYTDPEEEGYIKNKELKEELENIIEHCIKLDMYVIVDWHILNDNNPLTYASEAEEFFDEISKKYKDTPNVIYEICNEPNGDEVTWSEHIKPYAERIIPIIRKNSPDSLILVGTPRWCKELESVRVDQLEYDNIMYVVHFYPEDGYDRISVEMINALADDMALIVTETALTNSTGDGKLFDFMFHEWLKFIESNNISWVVWQLSDKEENSSLLIPKKDNKKDYNLNDYLSKSGKIVKKDIKKYSDQTK